MSAIGIAPAKTTSASHGVLNFGWIFRKTGGSWRYPDIAYVIRDAPITPAFAPMKRIVDARIPRYTCRTCVTVLPSPRLLTSPSTGSFW